MDEENKVKGWQLAQRQALPLDLKIKLTLTKIRQFYTGCNGEVYVAFSGGKDSTVLLHLVRSIYPNVPAVFADTGLEYPEIKEFVKNTPNSILLRPKLTFKQVLDQKGFPVISKSTARTISRYRGTKFPEMKEYYKHGTKNGEFVGKLSVIAKKHHYLIDAPFKISDLCCDYMKKMPFKIYERETGLKPYIGLMATDSNSRKMGYLKNGCNAFNIKHPHSTPLGFWTEKDIWDYLKQYNVPYCKIYDTGVKRTGCIFCMFGVNREKSPNRFEILKETHPQLWSYCINKLELGKVLDYMKVKYGAENDKKDNQ